MTEGKNGNEPEYESERERERMRIKKINFPNSFFVYLCLYANVLAHSHSNEEKLSWKIKQ